MLAYVEQSREACVHSDGSDPLRYVTSDLVFTNIFYERVEICVYEVESKLCDLCGCG